MRTEANDESCPLGGLGVLAAEPRRGLCGTGFPVDEEAYAFSTDPQDVYFELALDTRIGFGARWDS